MTAVEERMNDAAGENHLAATFRERAQQLAQRRRQQASGSRSSPLLVLRAGDECFGIELSYVRQVFPRVEVTPIPKAPTALAGIANLNGSPRSVIDLGRLLELGSSSGTHVVLLVVEGTMLALAVERVEDVRQIDSTQFVPLDSTSPRWNTRLTRGVSTDHVALLDPPALLQCALTMTQSASGSQHRTASATSNACEQTTT